MSQKLKCPHCNKMCNGEHGLHDHLQAKHGIDEPDFEGECDVCGCGPVVPQTGMCGPCTFGEADTVGGNW